MYTVCLPLYIIGECMNDRITLECVLVCAMVYSHDMEYVYKVYLTHKFDIIFSG